MPDYLPVLNSGYAVRIALIYFMKAIPLHRYLYVLTIILSLLACNGKTGDKKTTTEEEVSLQWYSSINDAYDQSVKSNRPILVYFAGSDTCGLCTQLESTVFTDPVFKTWASKSVVLLRINFQANPQGMQGSEDQNAAIARSLKVSTYPTIWILNITHEAENGRFKIKPVGYTRYQPSTEKLIGALQNFMRRPQ